LPEDPDIDAKISSKAQELQAARRAADLQARAALAPVAVPVFPAAYAELLAKTFEGVSADAERRGGGGAARPSPQARGEAWLSEGLGYVAHEECPFCGHGVGQNDLIQAYKSFFSGEYHALRDEVTALRSEVDAALGERTSAAIARTVLQNVAAAEFW